MNYFIIYLIVGTVLGWYYSGLLKKQLLLKKIEPQNQSLILFIVGVLIILIWPLALTKLNQKSAANIAADMKEEE
jgi:hypothetical protein